MVATSGRNIAGEMISGEGVASHLPATVRVAQRSVALDAPGEDDSPDDTFDAR